MDKKQIQQWIREFCSQQPDLSPGVPPEESRLLETALFLEDTFNITLSDEEITAENLGFPATIESLVLQRLEDRS